MEELKLVKIDVEYCNYLRKFDKKIVYNSEKKKNRPFLGILFQIDYIMYFAPLSSPKEKHLKMHDNIDFLKIDGGKLGVVNLNTMLPVQYDNIELINLTNKKVNKKYIKLLTKQSYWINRYRNRLYSKAYKLYKNYYNDKLTSRIKERCCNYLLLEEKCFEYNNGFLKC